MNAATAALCRLGPEKIVWQVEDQQPFVEVSSGWRITLNSKEKNLLLEVLDPAIAAIQNGATIQDAAIIEVGISFKINQDIFVVLLPGQMYINTDTISDASLAQFNVSKTVANTAPVSVAKVAFSLAVIVILVSMNIAALTQNNKDSTSLAETAAVAASDQPLAPAVLEDWERGELAPVAVSSSPSPGLANNAAKPSEQSIPVSKQVASASMTKPAVVVPPKTKVYKLDRETKLFEEYMLESRFDPAAARVKMRALLENVPRQSDLHRRIKNQLGS